MGSLLWRPADSAYQEAVTLTVGGLVCTLTSGLTSGSAYTSLAVTAIPAAVASGDFLVLQSLGSSQLVVAGGAASQGATSISVTSFSANYSYPVGTAVKDLGQPPWSAPHGAWAGGERQYTFLPGVSQEIPPEDYGQVRGVLQALQGMLAAPSAPTVTVHGTAGSTTYSYVVVAVGQTGDGLESGATSVTTGNATLSGTNYNQITQPTLSAYATGWRVVRTAGGTSQGDVSGVLPLTTTTFNDQSPSALNSYTQVASAPPVALVTAGPADQ